MDFSLDQPINRGKWVGRFTNLDARRLTEDLRVIYTEYTLAATDLGQHPNGELIRIERR